MITDSSKEKINNKKDPDITYEKGLWDLEKHLNW